MRVSISDIPKSSHRHLSLKEWLFLYQQLRLLVLDYNQVYGLILVSTKICFISFAMFGAYGAFRTEGVLTVFLFSVGAFCTCYLVLYIMLLGEVNDRSKGFLLMARNSVFSWSKGQTRTMDTFWQRKYVASLREMRMEVGSAYFIDKPIV